MYTRKIKLMTGKKKSKSTAQPISNWGPRIALAEKEKAISSLPETKYCDGSDGGGGGADKSDILVTASRKQNSYCISNNLQQRNSHNRTNNAPHPPPQNGRLNYKKVSMSSSSSHTTGSSGNNYIYNYARKSSSGGSSQKSFFLAHHSQPTPSSRSSQRSSSNKTSYGSTSYLLGGSHNSGSHMTLSTLSTVGETLSQPLTLLIPPITSDRFAEREGDFEGDDGGYNVMMERDQDSFPSTKTYCSSPEEEVESSENDERSNNMKKQQHKPKPLPTSRKDKMTKNDDVGNVTVHGKLVGGSRNPPPAKSEQIFANPAINLGILKLSTTTPLIHHQQYHRQQQYQVMHDEEYDTHCDAEELGLFKNDKGLNNMRHGPIENNDREGEHKYTRSEASKVSNDTESAIYDLRNICGNPKNKNNSIGSTISSLAKLTMVYVPMESLPRSKSAAVLNASLEFDPDLSKLVEESQEEREMIAEGEMNFPTAGDKGDPDNDSLLESFDSVMFNDGRHRDDGGKAHLQPISSPSSLSSGSSSCNSSSEVTTPTQPQSPNVTITSINKSETISTQITQSHDTATNCVTIASRNGQMRQAKSSIVIPPPLPPKNPSMIKLKSKLKFNDKMFANIAKRNNSLMRPSQSFPSPPSASQREMSIRTAVENLENIIRPQSTSPKPSESASGANKDHQKLMKPPQKANKRVTLTLPNECLSKDEQAELLLLNNLIRTDTDTEIDAYSSTFLTCGHVLKEDDYSTLSSTHSPPIISTVAAAGENMHDFRDHHESFPSSSSEISPTLTNNPGSSGSSGGEETFNSPSMEKEKNRSVLQQLRELSILIGGGGPGSGRSENDKLFSQLRDQKESLSTGRPENKTTVVVKSFRLHEDDSTRKLSDATDNSADSGKGSGTGSGSTSVSISGSSPLQSSPDSLQMDSVNQQQQQLDCHGVSSPCVFRSDCNECLMFNKPRKGFQKPNNSVEICGKSEPLTGSNKSLKKQSAGVSKKSAPSKLILRRKSSRCSKSSSSKASSNKPSRKKSKNLILEYCECSSCNFGKHNDRHPPLPPLPTLNSLISTSSEKSGESVRKVSTTSSSSGHSSSVKLSRSVAFRTSSRLNPRNSSKCSPIISNSECSNGLFTIAEEENASMDSKLRNKSYNENLRRNAHANHSSEAGGDIDVLTNGSPHWHPDCWLAADPLLSGWSDLESLYSLNAKNENPLSINGECWTCWTEISEIKRNSENPNGTVDRTKRMFIWLNKRHKEFQAPWWEAKKQASIRWVMTKALIHVPKEYLIDPFKESKKSKPIKYRLRDEVIKGLVSGKLYSFALANLYNETLGATNGDPGHGLCLWEIIKILSRRGVYVAQPSDMKLTEGTLRQKPIKIAAHIALIEAIMCLYSKEILARERIIATLFTFGCTVKSETTSPEKLVIAWINASVMTLKSYIMSSRNHQLSPEKQSRWLQVPKVGEIRDLCDGIGICSLFAIYCSNDLTPMEISVPELGETLTIYDSISNHTLVQKLCEDLFPETIYHLCVTDFLYIHGYMKQNILCFLVDLFIHLEVNPIVRVNRLTHVPIRVDLA